MCRNGYLQDIENDTPLVPDQTFHNPRASKSVARGKFHVAKNSRSTDSEVWKLWNCRSGLSCWNGCFITYEEGTYVQLPRHEPTISWFQERYQHIVIVSWRNLRKTPRIGESNSPEVPSCTGVFEQFFRCIYTLITPCHLLGVVYLSGSSSSIRLIYPQ